MIFLIIDSFADSLKKNSKNRNQKIMHNTIASFVWPAVQKGIYNDIKSRKSANPHTEEAESRKCVVFLLSKQLLDCQNSWIILCVVCLWLCGLDVDWLID